VLSNNEIGLTGDEGIEELCSSPHLGRLTELDLRNNPIGRFGRRLLRDRFGDALNLEPDY
jgi:hypothetical protein